MNIYEDKNAYYYEVVSAQSSIFLLTADVVDWRAHLTRGSVCVPQGAFKKDLVRPINRDYTGNIKSTIKDANQYSIRVNCCTSVQYSALVYVMHCIRLWVVANALM